jgi:adenylate cyclase
MSLVLLRIVHQDRLCCPAAAMQLLRSGLRVGCRMDKAPAGNDRERFWHDYLTNGDSFEHRVRRIFRVLPHDLRCQLCAAPFAGAAAPLMRAIGKRPAAKNPRVCQSFFTFIARHHGGAEIDATFLFADIRGSTTLAEHMAAADFHALLERFYTTASSVVFGHDGSVDKSVGDQIVAMFLPIMSGPEHAGKAVRAAEALLQATGHADDGGPWVPVGAGVHTGRAWVGAVGDDAHTELTALDDAVSTTARLASAAAAGEILVTVAAAQAAGLDPGLERRALELKGKEAPTDVVSLRFAAPERRPA